MSNVVDKKIFYINSRNRSSGDDGDFSHNLDLTKFEFDRVCVLQSVIPKSYYLIQSNYNTFQLYENGSTITITITPGNYTRRNFATTLQTLLNSATLNSYVYTVSFTTAPDNGKFVYSVSNNGGVQPRIIVSTFLFEQLGFNQDSTNYFVTNTLTSTNVVKLQKEDVIYIMSDIVDEESGILQEIYSADSSDFSNVKYSCSDVQYNSKRLSTTNHNIYKFTLTNEAGEKLNLNGNNYQISLLCYKSDQISKMISGYIKYQLLQQN